jgi:hypothetical protein
MNGKKKDKTIGRREFLKAVRASVVGLSTPTL